ncbi:MAG: TlpA family protein disulfide reductase [Deltaproteobacteria bacterium]|nr:MAG: TlpA family protein disulfide reductase [Deltaproteobacteria bacterium]TNF31688.1 MAG: TlpA family protein disulfide reductase [Deltaproteobacteria bacterium]
MRVALISFFMIFSLQIEAKELKTITLKEFKSGKNYAFNDQIGKKKMVINFWASWCTSCIEELPLLHALQEKSDQSKVVFLAINSGEKGNKIKKFLKRYDFKYLILEDPSKSVADMFGVDNLPQTIILDEKGEVIYRGNRPPVKLP